MQANLKCRVCGKEYQSCRSANRAPGIFRWQEVACSPECGEIYLKRIIESRSPKNVEQVVTEERTSRKKSKKPIVLETVEEVTSQDNEDITE